MKTFNEWNVYRTTKMEIIQMNVPFLIRAFEHVREDIKTDVELHKFVERIMAQGNKVLTMSNYNKVK
jgi:hypothetical protein